MPEGPEVRRIANCLREYLVGKDLRDIQYDQRSRYATSGIPNLDQLRQRLSLRVTNVFSRGKKIIIELGTENSCYLVSSLGLEGHWTLEKRNNSNLWLVTGQKNGILFILDDPLLFDDTRHFGTLEIILSRQDLEERLKDIGPDLLTTELTFEQWFNITRSGRPTDPKPRAAIQRMQICKFLMEQRYASGIGNYLKSEILWYSRVRPDRTIGSLSTDELERIRYFSHKIIRDSYAEGGHTLRTYTDIYGNLGMYEVSVYMKNIDPLGNPIRQDTFADGRTSHWVENLQQ